MLIIDNSDSFCLSVKMIYHRKCTYKWSQFAFIWMCSKCFSLVMERKIRHRHLNVTVIGIRKKSISILIVVLFVLDVRACIFFPTPFVGCISTRHPWRGPQVNSWWFTNFPISPICFDLIDPVSRNWEFETVCVTALTGSHLPPATTPWGKTPYISSLPDAWTSKRVPNKQYLKKMIRSISRQLLFALAEPLCMTKNKWIP